MMAWFSWLYVFLFLSFLSTHVSSSSLSSTPPPSASPSCHHDDRSALLQFNKSFSIVDRTFFSCLRTSPPTMSWESGTDCCAWNGVTCDTITGHVIGLDLFCGGLHGIIHSNSSLFQLSHLKTLNLSYNDFGGSNIPAEFGTFAHLLNLEIEYANFSGDIPPEISYLSKLQTIRLFVHSPDQQLRLNAFSFGRIATNLTDLRVFNLYGVDMSEVEPVSLMNLSSSSLTSLTIANCELQGNFLSHDKSFGPELYYLDLPDNMLNGTIPNWLYSLPSLRSLYLRNNRFTGHIHEFQTTSLYSLDLSNNMLYGSIPVSVFQQVNLSSLDLSSNYLSGFCSLHSNHSLAAPRISPNLQRLHLSDNLLNGTIPNWLYSLPSLRYLFLRNNRFTGYIHEFKTTSLIVLDLRNNMLHGSIPVSVFQQVINLSLLDLSSNYLSGFCSIHSNHSLAAPRILPNLQELDLSDNLLNGTIPNWLYSLPSLRSLYLRNNRFTGHIHEFQTTSLYSLDLSNNMLHGSIPVSVFQQVNLSSLDLSSNYLSGFCSLHSNHSLAAPRILPNLYSLDLSDNLLNGTIPNWLYSLPSLQYLNLGNNRFTGHMLHGSIPVSVFQQVDLSWLDLSSNNLSGFCSVHSNHSQLAAPRILPNLGWLSLSHNQIQGEVPKWLWNVGTDSLFFLNLSYNSLTNIERIPWRELQYIDLRSNLLCGQLPIPPPSIHFFLVSHNQMTGEVPSSICNLRWLEVLDLANNTLNGKLPPCMGTLSGNLLVLDMRMNKLHGMIPATLFGKKSALRTLNFNGNQLEGLLPPSLLNCNNLQVLDIGNNMINGTFPHWLESLPLLQVLILRSNKFHGSVPNPTVRFPFPKLRILDLSGNEFNDNFPAKLFENLRAMMEINTTKGLEYMGEDYYQDSVFLELKGNFIEMVKILTVFTTIDLSINNFEGEIPKSIGKLKSLKGLNFSHNKLNGFIPPSLGNLSELESLDLSSNVLVGTIPQQLTDITSLAVLNLAENRLVGRIPRGKQFGTFESNCYRGNLDLCGFPLSKLCEPQQPSSAHFQQEGEDELITNGLEWMMVSIGFGCGMVIGISIGYMVLSEKRIAQLMRCIGVEWLRKLLKRFKHKAR